MNTEKIIRRQTWKVSKGEGKSSKIVGLRMAQQLVDRIDALVDTRPMPISRSMWIAEACALLADTEEARAKKSRGGR